MKYKCQCPCGCNYQTQFKQHIHKHHIDAKSKGGTNKKYNLIYLCPNCHYSHIYNGTKNHNIKHENSFQILNVFLSTNGKCIEFKDYFGNIDYRFLN